MCPRQFQSTSGCGLSYEHTSRGGLIVDLHSIHHAIVSGLKHEHTGLMIEDPLVPCTIKPYECCTHAVLNARPGNSIPCLNQTMRPWENYPVTVRQKNQATVYTIVPLSRAIKL